MSPAESALLAYLFGVLWGFVPGFYFGAMVMFRYIYGSRQKQSAT